MQHKQHRLLLQNYDSVRSICAESYYDVDLIFATYKPHDILLHIRIAFCI